MALKLSGNAGISLQVLLDEEQEQMESAARFAQPRNTDSYDYANYHPLGEVSAHSFINKASSSSLAPFHPKMLHLGQKLLRNQG